MQNLGMNLVSFSSLLVIILKLKSLFVFFSWLASFGYSISTNFFLV